MLRFLFNVLSHLYYAHFLCIRQLDLHGYLNVVFKHFIYFVREFNLLDPRDTMSLDDLVDAMGMYSSDSNADDIQLESCGDLPRFSATPTKSKPPLSDTHSPSRQTGAARGNGSTPNQVNTLQSRAGNT